MNIKKSFAGATVAALALVSAQNADATMINIFGNGQITGISDPSGLFAAQGYHVGDVAGFGLSIDDTTLDSLANPNRGTYLNSVDSIYLQVNGGNSLTVADGSTRINNNLTGQDSALISTGSDRPGYSSIFSSTTGFTLNYSDLIGDTWNSDALTNLPNVYGKDFTGLFELFAPDGSSAGILDMTFNNVSSTAPMSSVPETGGTLGMLAFGLGTIAYGYNRSKKAADAASAPAAPTAG